MTGKKDYIESLSDEELRMLVGEFYDWHNEDHCPLEENADFPCEERLLFEKEWEEGERDGNFYTDECPNDSQEGCWVRYYIWLFRQRSKEKETKTQ